MTLKKISSKPELEKVVSAFEEQSGLKEIKYEVKDRSDGSLLILQVINPTDRYFKILANILKEIPLEDFPTPTLKKWAPLNRLQCPETKFFIRTLSESLNINRFSFKDEFFSRYTPSVSNAEAQIVANTNHIVYGRRGAGKSSLLLYALRKREKDGFHSAWIDMQTYEKRGDNKVAIEIISSIIEQTSLNTAASVEYASIKSQLERYKKEEVILSDDEMRKFLPRIRQALSLLNTNLFIFLDDFHLLDYAFQANFLGFIYSIARGNKVFLKISAIETLTKAWDAGTRSGLQVPHDAQTIKLDYNLTSPDMAQKHIEGILDTHAKYCGLPSIGFLCTDNKVLSRLVWVSAGVPRDALNMFTQAISKAVTAGHKRVSITDINMAASEMVSQKQRDVEIDTPNLDTETSLEAMLENIKDFCIKQQHKNAFLVEIRKDSTIYKPILELVDLRLVHVISEGITVGDAGRKYLGLILDYGFYTGIRAAQSVDLFNKQTERVKYKELRSLPIFNG